MVERILRVPQLGPRRAAPASDAPLALAVDGARHELPSRHDCLHIETAGGLAEYRIEPATASAALDACLIELPVAA